MALKAEVRALRKAKAGPDYAPTLARLELSVEELKARPTRATLDSGALGAKVRAAVGAVLTGPLREMQRTTAGVDGAARQFELLNRNLHTERDLRNQRNWWRRGSGAGR